MLRIFQNSEYSRPSEMNSKDEQQAFVKRFVAFPLKLAQGNIRSMQLTRTECPVGHFHISRLIVFARYRITSSSAKTWRELFFHRRISSRAAEGNRVVIGLHHGSIMDASQRLSSVSRSSDRSDS